MYIQNIKSEFEIYFRPQHFRSNAVRPVAPHKPGHSESLCPRYCYTNTHAYTHSHTPVRLLRAVVMATLKAFPDVSRVMQSIPNTRNQPAPKLLAWDHEILFELMPIAFRKHTHTHLLPTWTISRPGGSIARIPETSSDTVTRDPGTVMTGKITIRRGKVGGY